MHRPVLSASRSNIDGVHRLVSLVSKDLCCWCSQASVTGVSKLMLLVYRNQCCFFRKNSPLLLVNTDHVGVYEQDNRCVVMVCVYQ